MDLKLSPGNLKERWNMFHVVFCQVKFHDDWILFCSTIINFCVNAAGTFSQEFLMITFDASCHCVSYATSWEKEKCIFALPMQYKNYFVKNTQRLCKSCLEFSLARDRYVLSVFRDRQTSVKVLDNGNQREVNCDVLQFFYDWPNNFFSSLFQSLTWYTLSRQHQNNRSHVETK
jgi:hypothetical protein